MKARIVIFAKAPVAGKVKTRLIPALGAGGAAQLAAEMLARTIAAAEASGLPFELCTDPDPASPDWAGWPTATAQGEGDLGQRMARAAERVNGAGDAVLLTGTDCPDLTAAHLRAAAEALDSHDAVIHPAADGGYVLLGLRRFDPSLFEGIAWGTGTVAADTIARIRALGWPLHVGETLRDIDEPADLL